MIWLSLVVATEVAQVSDLIAKDQLHDRLIALQALYKWSEWVCTRELVCSHYHVSVNCPDHTVGTFHPAYRLDFTTTF